MTDTVHYQYSVTLTWLLILNVWDMSHTIPVKLISLIINTDAKIDDYSSLLSSLHCVFFFPYVTIMKLFTQSTSLLSGNIFEHLTKASWLWEVIVLKCALDVA